MHFSNLLNASSTLFFYFCWGSERKKNREETQRGKSCRETRETHDLQDLFGIIRNIFYGTVKCQPLHRKTFSRPSRPFEEDCCWRSSLGSVSVHHVVLMVLCPSDLGSGCSSVLQPWLNYCLVFPVWRCFIHRKGSKNLPSR